LLEAGPPLGLFVGVPVAVSLMLDARPAYANIPQSRAA